MKTTTFIIAIAAGLASVDSTGMLVDPPPRPISDDFRSKLPPTIRGLPERDLQKLPNDFVSKKFGKDTAKKFNDFSGPCAGIPRQPGRSTRVQLGRSSKFSFNVQSGSSDARCKLTLSCPNKSIEKVLWSGDCRDAKTYSQDVMIPRDVGKCGEGECYVQWLMETKADKFCNCVDVVVETPPSSTSSSSSSTAAMSSTSAISSSSIKPSSSSAISSSSIITTSSSVFPSLTSKNLTPSSTTSNFSSSGSSSSASMVSTSSSSSSSIPVSSTISKINSITSTAPSSSLSVSTIIASTSAPTSVLITPSSSSSSVPSITSTLSSSSTSIASTFTEKINSVISTIDTSTDVTSTDVTCTSSTMPTKSCSTCTSMLPTSTCSTCTSMTTSSACSTCTEASSRSDQSGSSTSATSTQPSVSVCSTCTSSSQGMSSTPQFTTVFSTKSAGIPNIPITVTEKNLPVTKITTVVVNSSGQCAMPSTATSFVSVPVTVTEATTAVSIQTSISTATVTSTEFFTTTAVSISAGIPITATEMMTNFQTVTATSTVTENVASIVPTTYVSTAIMTEKMLPVTVYMTSTEIQHGKVTTFVERISETATVTSTQTEKAISIATATTTAVSTVSVNVSCSSTTVINNVPIPTTLTSIVTEMRPITLTQKNVMTIALPGKVLTSTINVGSTYTVSAITTVTQVKSVPLACTLQVKTITHIMTTRSPVITSKVLIPTSTALVMTSKAVIPTSTVPSMSGGSICPTPPTATSPNKSVKAQATTSSMTSVSASNGSCQEGQKRCDMYDRRHYNECRGGQWSTGIKMTEADNMQCEESNGVCKLVPIPASSFHV